MGMLIGISTWDYTIMPHRERLRNLQNSMLDYHC
jgi:hypothetical protein